MADKVKMVIVLLFFCSISVSSEILAQNGGKVGSFYVLYFLQYFKKFPIMYKIFIRWVQDSVISHSEWVERA
jgi:hypothetical protein